MIRGMMVFSSGWASGLLHDHPEGCADTSF